MAFALAMGRGGFALMMFNNFKKKKKKRQVSFNNHAASTLLICFLEKNNFLRQAMHRINVSVVAYLHVRDPNVKMLHL